MYLLKRIAPRDTGMGWKIMKFHVSTHMSMDMRLFGTPPEFNTSSNESGHKESKHAASLTQKKESTFDFQTSTRLDEFHVIDLANTELTNFPLWKYYERHALKPAPLPEQTPPRPDVIGGSAINIFTEEGGAHRPVYSMGRGKEAKTPSTIPWNQDVIDYLFLLQTKLQVQSLMIRPEYKLHGQIYRGNPCYAGAPWRDWAVFDWGGDTGERPAEIWCFVSIDCLNGDGQGPIVGGNELQNGAYAVVERGYFVDALTESQNSSIFSPFRKEVRRAPQGSRGWKRKFYLVNLDKLTRPLAVVPNIGGNQGVEYFIVNKRSRWVEDFREWLLAPSADDVIGPEEPTPAHG